MITHERINAFFNGVTPLPEGDVFSETGFTALADWSERQPWWRFFALEHSLDGKWRSTFMGDSHVFAISLFAYLNKPFSVLLRAAQN